MNAPQHFFVTGGNSPIGYYFLTRLRADFPHAAITATYRTQRPTKGIEGVTYQPLDLADTASISASILPAADCLVHLASVTPGNLGDASPDSYFNGNVHGIMRLARQLQAQGSLRHVFYLSSSAVYNRQLGGELNECSEKTHHDLYGLSKLVFEQEITTLATHGGLKTLGLRVPVLLVEGVKHNFLSKWKLAMAAGDLLKIANPDAEFNAICPGWALYEALTDFLKAPAFSPQLANIFATQRTSLRAILQAMEHKNWEEVSAAPGQCLTSINTAYATPRYDALREVTHYLKGTAQ